MSRRSGGSGKLFIGRLSKRANSRDLEEVFEHYGRLARCDIKYGAEMAYAFVDFEDRRDAEDAVRKANGREICGSSIVVEWAKGSPRQTSSAESRSSKKSYDECYKCHRTGHWARDCSEDDYRGYRRRSASPRSRRSGGRDRQERKRSRSPSYEKKERSHRRQRSPSNSRSRSRSRSPYREPVEKRRQRAPSDTSSKSRSRSRSPRSRSSSRS